MTLFMPKSFTIQFLFIFSNFIGIKMHGREARVSTLEMRTKTPGRWVIVGSDWRERLHPCGPFPRGEVASHVSILLSECSVSLSLYALFLFSSLVHASLFTFHYSVRPSEDSLSDSSWLYLLQSGLFLSSQWISSPQIIFLHQ